MVVQRSDGIDTPLKVYLTIKLNYMRSSHFMRTHIPRNLVLYAGCALQLPYHFLSDVSWVM